MEAILALNVFLHELGGSLQLRKYFCNTWYDQVLEEVECGYAGVLDTVSNDPEPLAVCHPKHVERKAILQTQETLSQDFAVLRLRLDMSEVIVSTTNLKSNAFEISLAGFYSTALQSFTLCFALNAISLRPRKPRF